MGKEFKWYLIATTLIFIAMFGAMAIDSIGKSNCRAIGFSYHASVEEIERVCK